VAATFLEGTGPRRAIANGDITGRKVVMQSFRRIVLETGIAGGLLFIAHTYSPEHNFAAMWPFLTGAVAPWLATGLPAEHRLWTGLAAAVVAGVVAGAIAFVGISIVASLKVHFLHMHWEQPWQTGLITATSLFAFAMIGVVAVVCAIVGGIVLLPVRYLQLRRAHA
jgi:hypothetical protein